MKNSSYNNIYGYSVVVKILKWCIQIRIEAKFKLTFSANHQEADGQVESSDMTNLISVVSIGSFIIWMF